MSDIPGVGYIPEKPKPTIDEFLAEPKKPTIDEFLGPSQYYENHPLRGASWDDWFKDQVTGPGRLMNKFNQGYEEAFGKEPLGLDRIKIGDKSVTQHLRDAGVFNGAQDHWTTWVREFNEWLMRGTVGAADYAMRGAYATLRGAAATADSSSPLGAVIGPLGAAGSAAFEAFPAGHFTGFPEAAGSIAHPATVDALFDLAHKDSPHSTVQSVVENMAPDQGPGRPTTQVFGERPAQPPPEELQRSGLEQEANRLRQMLDVEQNPTQRANLQRQLGEIRTQQAALGEPQTVPATPRGIEALNELETLQGQREQLQTWMRDIIDGPPLTFRIQGVEIPAETPLQQVPEAVARGEETPTTQQAGASALLQDLRRNLDEIDKRIYDLVPEVREGRKAEGPPITYEFREPPYADVGLPPEGEVPLPDGVTAKPGGGYEVRTTEGTFDADTAAAATKIAAKYETLAQRRPTIGQEVYRDLLEAGRPDRESRANAAIVQAYYETRAARFEGRLGTPRDLYDLEAPDIKGAAGRNRGAFNLSENTIRLFQDADASTFLHESAHGWLEDILRDARRDDAPADLRADLDAIKEWLGMQADRPTRAQHERFARGFERYMMEGVAPTPKLAGVFAKFQAWLSKLYQTVSRLRAPITPEIRAVYDRLLSRADKEFVVQPERDLRASFADVHENDVRTTPVGEEIARAEVIRGERDDIGSILRAEIDAGRARARVSAGIRRTEAEGGPGGTIVPEPGARNVPTEPGGARPSAENAAVGAERNVAPVEVERVTSPDQPVERGPTRLIDKAGNIRLDNLNAPPDVNEALRLSADYNNGFGLERRGIVSDSQILDLATQLGMDASFLDRKAIGEAFNAEEIAAAKLLLRQSVAEVRAAAKELAEGGDSLKFAQAMMRNEMIQGKVAQATAEWGRAGRALREISSFAKGDQLADFLNSNKTDVGRNYDQLLQMARRISNIDSPAVANHFIRTTHGARFPILYYYLNSLLSGPITHAVYAIGNELRAITDIGHTAIAAGIGSAREIAAGEAINRVHWEEVWASTYGFAKGHLDGWRAAKEAFRTGQQVTLPGIPGYQGNMLLSGVGDVANPGTGFTRIVGGAMRGDIGEAGRGLAQLYGTPYRSVAAIHSFGATLRYTQFIRRYATRQALEEGLAGDALRLRIERLSRDPPDEIMEQAFNSRGSIMPDVPAEFQDWANIAQKASQEAMTQMYMRVYDYHSSAATIIRGLHSNAFTAMLVPFVKVGLEIQRENYIKHTPLGFASKEIRGQLLGREGGAALDEAQARLGLGMSLIGGGALLSALGYMTDLGPADENERAVWLLNHTPHSLQVGPLTVPLNGIPVLGSLLMFGADMYGAAALHWHKPEYEQLAHNYLRAFAHAAFDEGFFRDLGDIGSMVHEPGRFALHWLMNFVPNFLPWSVGMGQVNRFGFDPYSKDVHPQSGVLEAFKDSFLRQIPGESQYVPNRVDVFGKPILSRASWAAHFQEYKNDPVVQMLDRLHVGIGKLDRNIEGVELTTRQYEHYATVAGLATHKALEPLAADENFRNMPEGAQRAAIHQSVTAGRAMGRALIEAESMKNNPLNNIVTQAAKKKLDQLK